MWDEVNATGLPAEAVRATVLLRGAAASSQQEGGGGFRLDLQSGREASALAAAWCIIQCIPSFCPSLAEQERHLHIAWLGGACFFHPCPLLGLAKLGAGCQQPVIGAFGAPWHGIFLAFRQHLFSHSLPSACPSGSALWPALHPTP